MTAEWIAKRRKEQAEAYDCAEAYSALPKALDALDAVLAVIRKDEGIVVHNDTVPISRLGELVARPSPREYRSAIEAALRGEL